MREQRGTAVSTDSGTMTRRAARQEIITANGGYWKIFYTGSGWPTKSANLPWSGYSGPIDWDSELYAGAADPAGFEAVNGDAWSEFRA